MAYLSNGKLELSYVNEEVWGETPLNPEFKQVRGLTSETFGASKTKLTATEINPRRSVSYVTSGIDESSGGFDAEFNASLLPLILSGMGKIETTQDDPMVELYTHKISVTEPKSLMFQKTFDNIVFDVFKGNVLNTLTLTHDLNSFVIANFDFMVKQYEKKMSRVGSFKSEEFKPFDTIRFGIYVNDVKKVFNSLNLSFTNNTEMRRGMGELGNSSVGFNNFIVTGSFDVNEQEGVRYYQDKIDSDTSDSFEIRYSNELSLFMPKVKYTGDVIPKGAGQGLVNITVDFEAILDEEESSLFFIYKSDKPTL